ncbi:MAG TPA: hypothetical protein VNN79_20340 [Actinomycetota bacterium]|jgi:hypothetical protein|nr:hypothetical protein [Actinomycetota bacterium]
MPALVGAAMILAAGAIELAAGRARAGRARALPQWGPGSSR